jgi:diguanylate cyclase (GGDEF)-like protein
MARSPAESSVQSLARPTPGNPFWKRLAAFWSPPLPKSAALEFKAGVARTNLSRLRIFASAIFILTPLALVFDYLYLPRLTRAGAEFLPGLTLLHVILLAGALLLVLATRRGEAQPPGPGRPAEKVLEPLAVLFLLLWSGVFTGYIHPLGAGVGSHLMVVFVTVAFIVQPAPRAVAFPALGLAVLVVMILFLGRDPLQMRLDILNSAGMTLGAILVSQILYRTSVREFVGDQLIARQKRQLERVNERLKSSNERLVRISFLDPLTGIANRRYLDEYLGREWKRAAREGGELALIMADIDHFKAFNDIYGHRAGDECLVKVAGSLEKSLLRGADLVARFGGEEFAAVLPRTDLAGALELAQRMRREVAGLGLDHRGNGPGVVTISLGAASVRPDRDDPPESLIEAADKELYRAKEGGRNRVRPETG